MVGMMGNITVLHSDHTLSRRSFLKVAAAGLGGAILSYGPPKTMAQVGPQTGRPNIIVIITDDQDAQSLAVMRKMMSFPNGGWVNFSSAICNDAICGPSRTTLLTGQYSHNHGVVRNGYSKTFDGNLALPVWLKSAGYRTALIGKYLFGKVRVSTPPGWDLFSGRGGLADTVFAQADIYIRSAGEDPFFLLLAPVDPHIKAKPPARYRKAMPVMPPLPPNVDEADVSDKPVWVRNLKPLGAGKVKRLEAERLNAYRALMAVDDGVETVLTALAETGRLENTVIFYLSDHGFSWGSHRLERKHNPYEEVIRIPLVVRYPGVVANREESRVVSIVDLAATIADLAEAIPMMPQDGRSILPLLQGNAVEWENIAFIEKHPDGRSESVAYVGLRTDRFTYVEHDTGERELYDLATDPFQMENLAGRMEYEVLQCQLAARLAQAT